MRNAKKFLAFWKLRSNLFADRYSCCNYKYGEDIVKTVKWLKRILLNYLRSHTIRHTAGKTSLNE
jgi:hypothetical protein